MEFSFGASATKIIATTGFSYLEAGDILMILVACIMLYLAIWKKFEPLLLLPIGFGCLLANIPMSMMANTDAGGLLNFFYQGVEHEVLPPLIFLGCTCYGAGACIPGPQLTPNSALSNR